MGYAPRVLLAGGLGFAASFLVACGGGSNLLSGGQSSTLTSQLEDVSAAIEAGHCGGATRGVASFTNYVSNLPRKVSPTLRANLLQGASTVNDLAQQDCQTTTPEPTTSSSTTTPDTTTTTTTTTTPSTTSSTTTVSTTTPSTTTTTPATTTTVPSTSTTTPTTGGAGLGGTTTGGGQGNGSGGGTPGNQ